MITRCLFSRNLSQTSLYYEFKYKIEFGKQKLKIVLKIKTISPKYVYKSYARICRQNT